MALLCCSMQSLCDLGIPKPMIPYPLLWEGALRTSRSHLGRISNCSELPNPPPPLGNRTPRRPPHPPAPCPKPLPKGASGQQLVGGVVGVQNRAPTPHDEGIAGRGVGEAGSVLLDVSLCDQLVPGNLIWRYRDGVAQRPETNPCRQWGVDHMLDSSRIDMRWVKRTHAGARLRLFLKWRNTQKCCAISDATSINHMDGRQLPNFKLLELDPVGVAWGKKREA